MLEKTPGNYDGYIGALFAPEDAALLAARDEMQREGLPSIAVSASEGKALHTLVMLSGARRLLEIGTLGGYSAIWIARALPEDGKLISLELDPHHADVARRNVERAGLASRVEVRTGHALESLAAMAGVEPLFDAVFIDADKDGYPAYLEACLPLLRPGGLLLADNTLPDAALDETATSGAKRYNAAVAAHADLTSIVLPMLRDNGIDGLTVSVKR
ncbi:MAG TPA: class I SAM-dependent methyltransferase [Armatimonadota bacterium]|jgi:predicted O-methyltransferase YrrM